MAAIRRSADAEDWGAAFRTKALSSWRAAARVSTAHPDTCASRAYYAVHQAMSMRCGPTVPLPRDHGSITSVDVLARVGLTAEDGIAIRTLAAYRHMADYEPRAVWPAKAAGLVQDAARLLRAMGIEVSS